jgi:pimeloyl-ACP methyl ester carboxylesterase
VTADIPGGRVSLRGGDVEVRVIEASAGRRNDPALVLLHEGLGSISLWRDFPARLAAGTGRTVVVWSRHGYGRSRGIAGPRAVDYMHHEAIDVLPEFLELVGVARPILVGHSDGASIALIYAGAGAGPVSGLVAIAPHVFVEARSVAGIEAARREYLRSDLPDRLGRYHTDPDATFWGWNDVWRLPAFRTWNIEAYLATIRAPLLLVQSADDRYGSLDQLDRIERQVSGPVERLVLESGGHAPHHSHPDLVTARVAAFVAAST